MADEKLPCPYVGLRPFRESDYPFFFGRDREIRVVSSNLQAQPLTVLYGPSGVGKSSVLQAGVLPHLSAAASQAVVYFNEWQSTAFLSELTERCRQAAASAISNGVERLDDALEQAGRFFLLLDQFEEYLLYHDEGAGQKFDAILARIVNRDDVPAKVLIGIREDALSKLDQRFGIRIPNLLGNTLVVEHLDAPAARDAIQRPLAVFNKKYPEAESYQIEPELVEEILRQVQAGHVTASESAGLGSAVGCAPENRVETAFLQLVLTRLWGEEARAGSRTLRLETLAKIGGAGSIVQKHVAEVMAQFDSSHERDIAAGIFRYLVTPSRTKIAQSTPDLVSFGEAPAADVMNVLSTLTDRPDTRILRRFANPERYEIFHDVLAQPILDWRRAYLVQKESAAEQDRQAAEAEQQRRELEQTRVLARAEQELRAAEAEQQRRELEQTRALAMSERRRAEAEARSASRLRWMLAGVVVALLLAAGMAIYAFRQRQEARDLAKVANYRRIQGEAAKATALAAQKEAEAAKAQLLGKTTEAESLRAQAKQFSVEALQANQHASAQTEQLNEEVADLRKKYDDALQRIGLLNQQLSASEGQLRQLQTESAQLTAHLEIPQKPTSVSPAEPSRPSGVRTNPKDGLSYVWIAPGEFWMGATPGDTEAQTEEKPRHLVRITKGFWLGETLVTVDAYKRFVNERRHFKMPEAPSFNIDWSNPNHPIVRVPWNEAKAYCEWVGGNLPTEAEWEYAARGGRDGLKYPWGNEITPENANYLGSKWKGTSPVRSYAANAWGLYDMAGNAREWMADWYDRDYYGTLLSDKVVEDPRGPDHKSRERALRGGAFVKVPSVLRVSNRDGNAPGLSDDSIGFRCLVP
jgi:formylglycine-generating enzyme required for sulfatase activity